MPLLGKDGCIDRPANAVPMTAAARRNVPVRIADFYQVNDSLRGVRERRWTWIAHRLASIIGGDIGHVSTVERLGDIGHELIGTAAGVIVIELFVDRGSGLAGEVWKFWRRGYALLAVAGRANFLNFRASAFRPRLSENLEYLWRPHHLGNRCRRIAVDQLRASR